MIDFDVTRVAQLCQGALEGRGGDARITRVVIDSREVRDGDLFIALPGTRTHGHAHVPDALRRGAVAAIVAPGAPPLPEDLQDKALVRVKFPRKALADLARAHRRTLRCPVIAVTGSNGKSSTREIIAAALSPLGEIVQSPRSFNNELGVPLTILAAGPDTQALIVEMGTNGRGEIRSLCGIARPDMGVVTNVASAHLEGLGTLEGIAREKGALAEALPEEGLLVLNGEDERVVEMAGRTQARVVTYAIGEGRATVWGCRVERTPRGIAVWVYGKMRLFLPVMGVHNAQGAMAAVAVALALGVAPKEMRKGLRSVRLPGLRLEKRRMRGVHVLLDCYNANPESLQSATDELVARGGDRRKILILGDMRELGPRSDAMHRDCGRRLASRVDVLWCVGGEARAAYEAAVEAGMHPEQVFWSQDVETAVRQPAVTFRADDDLVLFKASRGMALEQMAEGLLGKQAVGRSPVGEDAKTGQRVS
jgi:UDP-N-acetylmuramoyl-tripeptide--D-alanyl-D-alanine ligase